MARRRLLLLLKPLNVYPPRHSDVFSRITNSKILRHLDNRIQVHRDAINFCQDVLRRKLVDWETMFHDDLSQPIQNVDLVVTVGGDGTILHASHFMDDTIPVLGVNSDPTQVEEVLDDILDKRATLSEISRISVRVNSRSLPTHALNDILIAHPSPACVSRFSFRIRNNGQSHNSLINCQSSGLRVSTAAGSTAAMRSAGGFVMSILSKDLQYMVREPILTRAANPSLMHGWIKLDQTMEVAWGTREGIIYVDGCHVTHLVKYGDTIELSSNAPVLKVFLPSHLLLTSGLANL